VARATSKPQAVIQTGVTTVKSQTSALMFMALYSKEKKNMMRLIFKNCQDKFGSKV
jgi:hypothetical protein